MQNTRNIRRNIMLGFFALATMALLLGSSAFAENTDPSNDGSQYAWGENVGWLNAEPNGEGGPGIDVTDTDLSGFLWGENIGWVSLSCVDTGSCGTVDYGVTNDGAGTLAGYAWAENVGWISFSCANTSSCGTSNYGVTIDPNTGVFDGKAWAENVGWISFAPMGGAVAFGVTTAWNAVPALACPECDLTGDNVVDFNDVSVLFPCMGQTAPLSPPCDVADVNGDGIVNFNDVSQIVGNFT